MDAGGAQAPARRGGEVSHSVRDPDPEPDPQDPHVFGPSGFISQRYGSADSDPHQNVTDPQHWFVIFSDIFLRLLCQRTKRIISFRPW